MTRLGLGLVVALYPFVALAQPASSEPAPSEDDASKSPAPEEGAKPEAPSDKVKVPEKPPTAEAPETAKFTWEPFGYLRMQYIVVQNDPNVAYIGRDDGFELQNARIGVRGKLTDRAAFTVALDGAVDERAQNTPQGKLKVGMRDAFADVTVSGAVVARGGYFQTWVDPQALVADTVREFVDKPLESRGMRSTEGYYTPGLPPGRSLGAALRFDPPAANKVGFEIAVQNGADEFASNNDNDKPALSVSALFRLADNGFVVASGRFNPRTVGELPFRQDETDLQASLGAQVNAGAVSLGLGGIVQRTTFESTGGPVQNAYGAHAQLMFKIPASLPFAVGYRFGLLDPSSLILTDRVMEHTVGAVLGVPSLRMRVQLQLTHVAEQAARELSNDRAQLAAEVAL